MLPRRWPSARTGRDDLRGGDVVTRAEVDDHLDLTDQHRDLFLGQAVTRAHLRPNIHGRSRPRQAGRRAGVGRIKLITAPAKTIRIMTHPARVTPAYGQKLSNSNLASFFL